jgi:hypothetical protein
LADSEVDYWYQAMPLDVFRLLRESQPELQTKNQRFAAGKLGLTGQVARYSPICFTILL